MTKHHINSDAPSSDNGGPSDVDSAAAHEDEDEVALYGLPSGTVDGAAYFSRRPSTQWRRPSIARKLTGRPLGLFVIRESDTWNLGLFDMLRDRTYLAHRDKTEVEAVRQEGMKPFFDDTVLINGQTVLVERRHSGNTTAVLFFYGGYWHLWCQGSAAKVDSVSGANDFTEILVEVLEELQPQAVYAANLSRLVRSVRQVAVIATALNEYVDELVVGEYRFSFTGPNAQISIMMLNMLAWSAAMERDAIVMRTLAGRIAKWRRQEWFFGRNTLPFGYVLDKQKRLVPDLDMQPVVEEMLKILASDLPNAELVRQLSAVGVTGMREHRRLKKRAPIGLTTTPDQAIRSLFTWAPIWVSGEYLLRHANPFPSVTELAGLPIVRHCGGSDAHTSATQDAGEFQMLYKVDVPEGGWAAPEVLTAFSLRARAYNAKLLSRGRTPNRPLSDNVQAESVDPGMLTAILPPLAASGGDKDGESRRNASRARRRLSALTGRNWIHAGKFYELQAVATGTLRLVRWEQDPMVTSATDLSDDAPDGGSL